MPIIWVEINSHEGLSLTNSFTSHSTNTHNFFIRISQYTVFLIQICQSSFMNLLYFIKNTFFFVQIAQRPILSLSSFV